MTRKGDGSSAPDGRLRRHHLYCASGRRAGTNVASPMSGSSGEELFSLMRVGHKQRSSVKRERYVVIGGGRKGLHKIYLRPRYGSKMVHNGRPVPRIRKPEFAICWRLRPVRPDAEYDQADDHSRPVRTACYILGDRSWNAFSACPVGRTNIRRPSSGSCTRSTNPASISLSR